jgi:cytochrome c biogenesis protein CcmG/thiol:disulfide interchange protein DsbE
MKTALFTLMAFTMLTAFTGDKKFPAASLKTLDVKDRLMYRTYIGKGNPVIVSFWASWCSPCKRELDAMTEIFPEWQANYKVELLAITIDDSRGLAKVPGIVTSKSWPFTVLADTKQELQQNLGFQTVPETFLLDGEGNIVYTPQRLQCR